MRHSLGYIGSHITGKFRGLQGLYGQDIWMIKGSGSVVPLE